MVSPRFEQFVARAAGQDPLPVCAVAHPCDATALEAAVEARRRGLFEPVLVGPSRRIHRLAETCEIDLSDLRLVDTPHSHASAAQAVTEVQQGRASLLMKGSLHSDELLHAVISHQGGLRTERKISHVFIMDVPGHDDLLFITDAAINIEPDLDCKADIVRNAIQLHHALGLGEPRVAILSAVEQVTAKLPSTIDAAALCKMADRRQITGGWLDGPLALDNAISPLAARMKEIDSPVAGRAQVLVVPDLEAGNMLAKNLSFLANAAAAGVVVGARVPIILTSRADTLLTRLTSCAVAILLSHHLQQQPDKIIE